MEGSPEDRPAACSAPPPSPFQDNGVQAADVTVLFTDCDMPGLKGPALATIVSERWTHVRIMLTSGKPVKTDELPDGSDFISKPLRPSTLVPKLEALKADVRQTVDPARGQIGP
jgi:FixJ family two-component response regulator